VRSHFLKETPELISTYDDAADVISDGAVNPAHSFAVKEPDFMQKIPQLLIAAPIGRVKMSWFCLQKAELRAWCVMKAS
jgi:hypothetical protein